MDMDLRKKEKYQYSALVVTAGRNFKDALDHCFSNLRSIYVK